MSGIVSSIPQDKFGFFTVPELVSPEIYALCGDKAIEMIDARLVRVINKLRHRYGPITINNYSFGGRFKESGLRNLNTSTGAPRSAHKQGKGLDLKFSRLTPAEVWADMKKTMDAEGWDDLIRRIEDPAVTKTWLHIDTIEHGSSGIRVFQP